MMPSKPLASFPASGKEPKRQKKVMTLHEKVELLDMVKEGKSHAAVGRNHGECVLEACFTIYNIIHRRLKTA